MGFTIAEADKYSQSTLLTGVIEEILKESPILNVLPFAEILGNSLTYNRETTLPSAGWYAPGDTWVEGTPTITPVTVTLKILGGDSDVDNFLRITRSNKQELEAIMLLLKAKALAHEFEDAFIYGDDSVNAKLFDGLHTLIGSGAQQVNQGTTTTGAAGTLSDLDEMIDLVKPGRPDLLIMSRRSSRGINKLARSQGSALATTTLGSLGRPVQMYGEVPIAVSDFISDAETIATDRFALKTGGACSSIFAIKVGEGSLMGLEATEGIVAELIGALETKDARRWRTKWYTSLALLATVAIARMDGITSADWTN